MHRMFNDFFLYLNLLRNYQDFNDQFSSDPDANDELCEILGHRWIGDALELKCKYYTGDVEYYHIDLVKTDDPLMVANYISIFLSDCS